MKRRQDRRRYLRKLLRRPRWVAALSVVAALAGTQAGAHEEPQPIRPDPDMAYLVIGARVIPAGEPQPKWIHIARKSGVRRAGYVYLPTDAAIHALEPGRYSVRKFSFRDSRRTTKGTQRLGDLPEFKLEAGKVYYYGTLEVDQSGHDGVLSTRVDSELYSRACEQAPYVLIVFGLEWLFPERAGQDELPDCDPAPSVKTAAAESLLNPVPEAPPERLASDAGKAFLIISQRLVPEGTSDVAWSRLENDDGERYWIGTDAALRPMPPGSYRVVQVYHRSRVAAAGTRHAVETFPRVSLDAGKLYYYGVLELDVEGEKHVLSRRFDPDLLRQACGRVPDDMQAVPVEFLFDDGAGAVTCSRSEL